MINDLKEESSVCASKRAKHILFQPDCFVSYLPCCPLLAVEHTLQPRQTSCSYLHLISISILKPTASMGKICEEKT